MTKHNGKFSLSLPLSLGVNGPSMFMVTTAVHHLEPMDKFGGSIISLFWTNPRVLKLFSVVLHLITN